MIIRVTKADIKNGKRGKCRQCPVSLAMRRAIDADILVGPGYFTIGKTYPLAFSLPKSALLFVKDFDAGRSVKPFSFRIKKPL